ncbi:hypothetical protein HK104_004202 [Borealophlyctis nickersoniae]|nr:hypothetical protein HK104_004202 [Borealophlyctis nickersoniae]
MAAQHTKLYPPRLPRLRSSTRCCRLLWALMFAALLTASYFNFQNAPRRLTGRLAHHLIDPDLNEDLIVYVYFEAPEQHDNLLFFLKHGLHAKADFVFVINGEYDPVNITFPQADNIRVLQRPNECMDLGTFPIAIRNRWRDTPHKKLKKYTRFFFSFFVIPPVWSNECWSDVFLNRINKEVKMVGLTYNCMFIPHVQSMLLAMDHTSLRIISRNLQCYATKVCRKWRFKKAKYS